MNTTPTSTISALRRATLSTFEMLGFLMPLELDGEERPERPMTAGARVRFRGQVSGALEIEVFGDVVQELTVNMLALERPASRSEELSALGEVANVVCGNVLPELFGVRAVFDLSAPEAGERHVLRTDVPDAECLDRVEVDFEGGHVVAQLRRYA